MLKRIIAFLFAIVFYFPLYGYNDTLTNTTHQQQHTHFRISLISCGLGNEAWQTFGHSAVRVIDSGRNDSLRDVVYNYAAYDGFDGDFYVTFLTRKLIVYLEVVPYKDFIQDYVAAGRSVYEQEFLLDDKQKEKVVSFLENNAQIENRCYEYLIFFDNCCTRARDIFPLLFGNDYIPGDAVPKNIHISFRETFNLYYRNRDWERVGINIFMGATTDTVIRHEMITYLPEFLSIAMAGATLNGKKLCADKTTILEDHVNHVSGVNQPFIVCCFIALITIVSFSFRQLRVLGKVMSVSVLVISGILSICILYFWIFSVHIYCRYDFNLLWALPTNLFIPFFNFKGKGVYALVGMSLIFLSLIIHILKIQILPLFEIGPYLLALLCVYGMMYRNSKIRE